MRRSFASGEMSSSRTSPTASTVVLIWSTYQTQPSQKFRCCSNSAASSDGRAPSGYYAMLGALAGAALGQLAATYLILFGAMLDLGIVQNPMFGSGEPPAWGALLPGYGPGRVILDAAFSDQFHAWGALAISFGWALGLAIAVLVLLGRLVGVELNRTSHDQASLQ
jgi:hypothetical protein